MKLWLREDASMRDVLLVMAERPASAASAWLGAPREG